MTLVYETPSWLRKSSPSSGGGASRLAVPSWLGWKLSGRWWPRAGVGVAQGPASQSFITAARLEDAPKRVESRRRWEGSAPHPAPLHILRRRRAVPVSCRRRSRIEGKPPEPAAPGVLSGVSFEACCLHDTSVRGCFIGNAGTLSLFAMQGSIATRMRVNRGEESTSVCILPTFSAQSAPRIVFRS